MGRTDWAYVVLAGLLAIVCQPTQVAALSCLPCEYNTTCQCLPENCQKALRPCGCCYECMGKVGESCSGLMVPYVSPRWEALFVVLSHNVVVSFVPY